MTSPAHKLNSSAFNSCALSREKRGNESWGEIWGDDWGEG